METQKIINLLNDSSNEESKFAIKMVCYRQSQKVNITKTSLLNLKQKPLNQVFMIILMRLF